MVTVTGKGYLTVKIPTGPDELGDRFKDIQVQSKQTCMLHGGAVVRYYTQRVPASPLPLIRIKSLPVAQDEPTPSLESAKSQNSPHRETSPTTTSTPLDITIRIQIDGTGRFSAPFPKSILRPRLTTTDFFSFIATQTSRNAPDGPPCLKFTLKDAMPIPYATEIARGNEDHFNYMRRDIKVQYEKAGKWMPELREFVVLVTVPGWVEGKEEEEDW